MHPRVVIAVCAIGLASPSFAGNDAAVEGVVQLPAPTPERPLDQRYRTSEAVLAPSNPPAAVVYLEGDFSAATEPAAKTTAEMSQKNMQFSPDLVAVHIGTAVAFPNLDDTYHNVFSYSKTKRFDLGRYRKDERPGTVIFDKPGVVTVHCEIHDRMRGTILVLETPYFQKTDTFGHYRMDHLPAGHFLLKAWVSDTDVRTQQVDLKQGAALHVDFAGK
ncbi:MAG TPA: plastocyanin/azurin family copper-binding protein [Chthoniobacterales bacterium]|nr:plastocyanin/azurin family copper-binding protein [Chthoniobacterales bacterium]